MTLAERSAPRQAPAAVLLIRLMVGAVFLSEGIQKFLFPAALGVGRFTTIGIPAPQLMAPFIGAVETICGLLLIAGFVTRLATIPLLIDILVAIATTKIPMLLKSGFWAMAHEARTDYPHASRVDVPPHRWRWSLVAGRTTDRTPHRPLKPSSTGGRDGKKGAQGDVGVSGAS